MGWPKCNSTLEDEKIHEIPVWHTFTFHRLGLWLSAVFSLLALALSFFLIYMHAIHYLRPREQVHIIRILFMVPVYAMVSFLSYKYYTHSVYFELLGDCYEAFAIASFFSLLCHYIAEDLHQQKNYFRTISPKPWIWPMKYVQKCWGGEGGIWRTPRSGLTWFNVIWTGVFQYCFIRVFMTCVAVVTEAVNLYCLESLNPAFSHIWVMGIEALAVTIAMYCLLQFYWQIKEDIAQHKPLLKVIAIKLVIFLSFWQTILISFLTSTGAIKTNHKFDTPDIKVGLPSMLLCIEMAIFAVFHFWAFPYQPYKLTSKEHMTEVVPGEEPSDEKYRGGFLGIKALIDAMNPWDMIKAVARAGKWLFKDRRHRENDSSYAVSRIGTNLDAFDSDQQGQKLSMLGAQSTAYKGAGEVGPPQHPNHYGHRYGEENVNLLANAQSFGASRPEGPRMETSPYRSDSGVEYESTGDIGVAKSKDYPDEEWDGRYPQGHSSTGQRQEAGVVSLEPDYGNPPDQRNAPYFAPPFQPGRGRRAR